MLHLQFSNHNNTNRDIDGGTTAERLQQFAVLGTTTGHGFSNIIIMII